MTELIQSNDQKSSDPNRRAMLRGVSLAGLSGIGLSLLAGCQTTNASSKESMDMMHAEADADILNIALGLEHEAIAAYGIAGESGLLQPAVLDVALLFRSHHQGHRDVLTATISQIGGTPVEPKSTAYYADRIKAQTLKSQADVLALATELEGIAANAYLSVIPKFHNTDFAQVAGRIVADETMHWTALKGATGSALPADALTFGV